MHLKKLYALLMLFTLTTLITHSTFAKETGPIYQTEETREIINAMIAAHGGYEKWRSAETISFDSIMHNNYHQKGEFAWWVARETIHQDSRKAYLNWPYDKAVIGYDGENVWADNWRRANLPPFMVHFFYYFVNLPWLTQDSDVELSAASKFSWPGLDKELHEIKMTFKQAPTVGKSENDYFVLYIDPDSHLLVGYQYAIGYRPQLDVLNMPPERKVFGPLWRFITKYTEVDGLIFPSAFRTMPEADERIVGNHLIMNISLSEPFNHQKSKATATAKVFDDSAFKTKETNAPN